MAKPTNRTEFRDYCLRSLGQGAITINVTEDQIQDRIDEAISFYQDYHYAGQVDIIVAHEITAADITNKYITTPSNVLGIGKFFKTNLDYGGLANWMSIKYQMRFDDVFYMSREGIKSYYIAKVGLSTFDHILSPQLRYRYHNHSHSLYVDYNWDDEGVEEGNFFMYEARAFVDPEVDTEMWGNRILQKICTAYIKRQWGENLKKFVGVQMAGGVALNADKIYDDAQTDINALEEDFILKYQMPDDFLVG